MTQKPRATPRTTKKPKPQRSFKVIATDYAAKELVEVRVGGKQTARIEFSSPTFFSAEELAEWLARPFATRYDEAEGQNQ